MKENKSEIIECVSVILGLFIIIFFMAFGPLIFMGLLDINKKECYKPADYGGSYKTLVCESQAPFFCSEYRESINFFNNAHLKKVKLEESCPTGYEDKGKIYKSINDLYHKGYVTEY